MKKLLTNKELIKIAKKYTEYSELMKDTKTYNKLCYRGILKKATKQKM